MSQRLAPSPQVVATALCCAFTTHAAGAPAAAEPKRSYNLPPGDAATTLNQFAGASGRQIVFMMEKVKGERTNAVTGEHAAHEALDRMLAGTGLSAARDPATGAFVVTRRRTDPSGTAPLRSATTRAPPITDATASAQSGSAQPKPGEIFRRPVETPTAAPPAMKRNSLLAQLAATLGWLAATAAPADAQLASPAPSSTSRPVEEKAIELSPFVVDTTRDRGYQAENTLSGTRLNASLGDTPASVSVMTRELLQDIGLDGLTGLMGYSVNSQVHEFDTGAATSNDVANGRHLVKAIDTRGVRASQALDYFKSITPDDSYRIHRYDDSRGPNSILFGISDAGGLINQTSKSANPRRNQGSVKWSIGSHDRNRYELDLNKVLRNRMVAVSLAAVRQDNGGWRLHDFDDKKRVFGALVVQPNDKISINIMGETGRDRQTIFPGYTPGDEALAWLDNRNARGLGAVTFTPLNANPTAAQQALGVTLRNSVVNGVNRRLTFVANDGVLFDAVGTYLTGSYNNPVVRAPDGARGVSGTLVRVNDPTLLPYTVNAAGPGMFRDFRIKNYTVTADWQVAKGLFANFGHNFQQTDLKAYFVPAGTGPLLRGEPNTTLGVLGRQNPYAGRLYFESGWKRDAHLAERKENRLSLSYEISPRRLGSHRVAGMVSQVQERDSRVNSWVALAGSAFGVNGRISTRNYVDESKPATFTGGDWRSVPSALQVDGRSYDVTFVNDAAGVNNTSVGQEVVTRLVVAQSHFLRRKLVTTLGYRQDRATSTTFGYAVDARVGDIPDFDPAKAVENESRAATRTAGIVYHAGRGVSLLANASSSISLPDFVRRIFPDAAIPGPTDGQGRDYGVSFSGWNRKLTAKIVYFETSEKNTAGGSVNALFINPNLRIVDAFESVLVGPGRPIAAGAWPARRADLAPAVNGALFDVETRGYEFSTVANPTDNWRVMMNYSYTDRTAANLYVRDVVPWYGFQLEGGLIRNGVAQNAAGTFVLDPNAFATGGTVAKWLELSRLAPQAGMSVLTTTNGQTIAQEVFNIVAGLNQQKRMEEQRWGLRPHRLSVFAAYDFTRDTLKGVSLGAGYRWRSANIIGADTNGNEIMGRALGEADLMLRYARKLKPALWKGNLIFQVNVINALNEQGIVPKYFASTPPFEVPGGRGLAYNRFDLIVPRSIRFTTTYEF